MFQRSSKLTDGLGRFPLGVRGAALAVDRASELLRAAAEQLPDESARLERIARAADGAAESLQRLALTLDAAKRVKNLPSESGVNQRGGCA